MIAFLLHGGVVCLDRQFGDNLRRHCVNGLWPRGIGPRALCVEARERLAVANWLLENFGVDTIETIQAKRQVRQSISDFSHLLGMDESRKAILQLNLAAEPDIEQLLDNLVVTVHGQEITLPYGFVSAMQHLGWFLDESLYSFLDHYPQACIWLLENFANPNDPEVFAARAKLGIEILQPEYQRSSLEEQFINSMRVAALDAGILTKGNPVIPTRSTPASTPDFRIIRLRKKEKL